MASSSPKAAVNAGNHDASVVAASGATTASGDKQPRQVVTHDLADVAGVETLQRLGELHRLGEAVGVREVRPGQDALDGHELGELVDVFLPVRHHPDTPLERLDGI